MQCNVNPCQANIAMYSCYTPAHTYRALKPTTILQNPNICLFSSAMMSHVQCTNRFHALARSLFCFLSFDFLQKSKILFNFNCQAVSDACVNYYYRFGYLVFTFYTSIFSLWSRFCAVSGFCLSILSYCLHGLDCAFDEM